LLASSPLFCLPSLPSVVAAPFLAHHLHIARFQLKACVAQAFQTILTEIYRLVSKRPIDGGAAGSGGKKDAPSAGERRALMLGLTRGQRLVCDVEFRRCHHCPSRTRQEGWLLLNCFADVFSRCKRWRSSPFSFKLFVLSHTPQTIN
jgi:hypothetical protein